MASVPRGAGRRRPRLPARVALRRDAHATERRVRAGGVCEMCVRGIRGVGWARGLGGRATLGGGGGVCGGGGLLGGPVPLGDCLRPVFRASSALLCDLLDAPTALAACCGIDLCYKYIWYWYWCSDLLLAWMQSRLLVACLTPITRTFWLFDCSLGRLLRVGHLSQAQALFVVCLYACVTARALKYPSLK